VYGRKMKGIIGAFATLLALYASAGNHFILLCFFIV